MGATDPARSTFVIARFDALANHWQDLARIWADDRIDALNSWALSQGGFDRLERGVYGSRHEHENGPWYRRVKES